MLRGRVGQTTTHNPQPMQPRASMYTRPSSSASIAASPIGQIFKQLEHSPPFQARQESRSSTAVPIHEVSIGATTNAPVGQALAQGTSTQAVHGLWSTTLKNGVPAAIPAPSASRKIAPGGQASAHASQRVQAIKNSTAGRAPGGR